MGIKVAVLTTYTGHKRVYVFPTSMPSLITKWKKGRPYLSWVRSARVKGQLRMVEQLYLGVESKYSNVP